MALEIADRTLEPREPLAHGTAEGTACELYAQALYWAASARMELEASPGGTVEDSGAPAALFERIDPRVLAGVADGGASAERARDVLSMSFIEPARLERKEQAKRAEQLRTFAQALLAPLDSEQRRLERRWARRVSFSASVLAALAIALIAKGWLAERRARTTDLAPHSTWSASTFWMGCKSPAQQCPESTNFFFHTAEEPDPSITFDLGAEHEISALWIENRPDCCGDRAVPLVVEVSTDARTFERVARRDAQFSTWYPDFPAVRARWVKLHVPRRTFLHLARVRIIP